MRIYFSNVSCTVLCFHNVSYRVFCRGPCIAICIVSWCEQSLSVFFRFSEGSARACETRETRACLSRLAPSRPQVRAWSFACLARFARQTKEKETARSPHYQYIIRIAFTKSNLPRIPLQPQMLLFLNVVVSRQWIITVDNKTILLW